MTIPSDHWQRALSLMDTAVTLRPDERDAWLARMAADEPLVAPLLRKLLSARQRVETNDILATLPRLLQTGDGGTTSTAGSIGAHIGPFELIEPLGRGGMGSVWRARYIDGRMKRDVAVKLPATSDNPAALASLRERFARERDFLAQLEHPNIARLYDTGISDTGQPYLAMEYVAGEPIDSYCDSHRLTIKARLTLYLQVLDAVEFAHRQLVLHRDLKPGNVLVDANGQARLLDFGVAKLLPETSAAVSAVTTISAGTDLTEIAGTAITLAYAAPEQINNGKLSTATDVYALGVMLYRLLTGCAPYQPKRDTRGALEDEVLTVIPSNASARFATQDALDARQSTEVALRRTLAGDIDTILAKALKKNADERYPTVNAFAQDIERALHGYRVLAQPDSAWYRTRKFVQRHPWAVAVSSAGVVMLMMVATVAVWQASVARTQAVLAERESDRAKAVQQFLVSLFQSAKPEQSRGKQLTLREVLDRNAPRIEAEFTRQPETAAALAGEIGAIYESLGDLDKAVTNLARKVALLEGLGQQDSVDYVDANERLGRYLVDADRYGEAQVPLARALESAVKIEPRARERRLHASITTGRLKLRTGKIAEAQAILVKVQDEIAALPNVTPKIAWLADMQLSEVMSTIGKHEEALKLDLSALKRVREDRMAESIDVLNAESSLAQTEFTLRHLDEAQRLFQNVMELSMQLEGANSSQTLYAKTGLARTIGAKGDYRRAITLQDEVIAAARAGGDASEVARAQMFQIRNLIGDVRYMPARQLVESAFTYYSGLQSGTSRYTERLRALRAEILLALGEFRQAEVSAREALRNQEEMFDASSPQIAQTLDTLGAILRVQARYSEAVELHQRAFKIHVKAFGLNHVQSLRSETYLAVARIGMNQQNATADFMRTRNALVRALGPDHPAQKQLTRAEAWIGLSPSHRSAGNMADLFCLIDF
jgi:eukaryotic-like serine/threonine-protein kinase